MKPEDIYVGKISGFALPVVVVISVLVMTVLAMSLLLVTMDSQVYGEYQQYRQRMMDLESVLTVYRYDREMFCDADTAVLNAPSGLSGAEMSVVRRDWGLYECVTASDGEGHSITRLYGRISESQEEAAFWLCDRNRALTLDSGAGIDGKAYIPPNGINYSGEGHVMPSIREEFTRISLPELPPLDSGYLQRIHRMFLICKGKHANTMSRPLNLSSQYGPDFILVESGDSVLRVDGMAMLYGDEICISGESVMHDVIVCARKVTVRDGFRGCMQIFCTDSVSLQSGVWLEWPSGICVASDSGFPHVNMGYGARIDGYVVVTGAGPDRDLEYPGYVHQQGAVLNGLLYADCSCEIGGDISGAAYVRDCFHVKDGVKYPGTISSVMITRDARLAFPILMKGDYARRAIKKLK